MTTLNEISWQELALGTIKKEPKRSLPFTKLWDHQLKMVESVRDHKRLLIQTSRRMGTSTALQLLSLSTVACEDTNVMFIDRTSLRSKYSFEGVANFALALWKDKLKIDFKIDRASRTIRLGSKTIWFVSAQEREESLVVRTRGCGNYRIFGEDGCLDDNPQLHTLLQLSESSVFVNNNNPLLRNHKVERFPWHMHHPAEFKEQTIQRYGQRVWDMEFNV